MKNKTGPEDQAKPQFQSPSQSLAPPIVDSQQLLGNGRECWITHAGQTYRLCHTRNDKLILIK